MKPLHTLLIFLLSLLPAVYAAPPPEVKSLVRINSTIQHYNTRQPWERNNPYSHAGLGAVIKPGQVITSAEMAANSTYIELESSDGNQQEPAQVLAVDYEANLALLSTQTPYKDTFLEDIKPLELGPPSTLGSKVDIWQIESNGKPYLTKGTIRSVELLNTFVSGNYFLSYRAKASMQRGSSSFTLPAIQEGKLLGVITGYNSKDQLSDIISPEVIRTFLEDASDGDYEGFPSLGISTGLTKDPYFREWLGLSESDGGIYITRVVPNSAAQEAGLEKGDIILSLDGHPIDRRGYYEHPVYGPLFWTHLVRGEKKGGEELKIVYRRGEKTEEIIAKPRRKKKEFIPRHLLDSPPPYLIAGGFIFQELNRNYLTSFGDKWSVQAPLNLLDAYYNPEDYEEGRNHLVFLSAVIPTPATLGYERLGGQIVLKANGEPVKDLADLARIIEQSAENGIHDIEIDDIPHHIYLDQDVSAQVNNHLLKVGLPSLKRIPPKKEEKKETVLQKAPSPPKESEKEKLPEINKVPPQEKAAKAL